MIEPGFGVLTRIDLLLLRHKIERHSFFERRTDMQERTMGWLVWMVVILFALAVPAWAAKGGGGKQGGGSDSGWSDKADRQSGKDKHEYEQEREQERRHEQGDRKMEQERKELGKGSETGQRQREEHSRKWWRFWD